LSVTRLQGAAALVAIAAVALVLRLIGLQFGLPSVYNPDEVAIMSRALAMGKGSLNPHNFLYPTFFFYVLFAWVGLYLAWSWITGRVASLSELPSLYFTDPTGIYTAGRVLGVISGVAGVLLLYRLAHRFVDRRAAIAASLLLATAPLHVRDSHYVKHDVFATTLIIAAYLAISRVWPATAQREPATRDVVLAGAACGMAFSTHYYCVFLAIPLAYATFHAFRALGTGAVVRQLGVAAVSMIIVFILLSPFLLVEASAAWRDIVANRQIVVDRGVTTGPFAPAVRYVEMLVTDSMGVPAILLAIMGGVWMTATQPSRAMLLLAFPVAFFLFITNTVPASRYLNPVLPFVAIFAGWMLSQIATRFRLPAPVFWVAVVAAGMPGAIESYRTGMFFRQDDTRSLAQAFIENHVADGSSLAIQPYSVQLDTSKAGLIEALTQNVGSAAAASTKFQLQLAQSPYPSPAYRLIYLGSGGLDADKLYVEYSALQNGLEPLRRLGVAYIVVKRYNTEDPATARFLSALVREGRQIAAFSPYRSGVTGAEQALVEPFLHNTDSTISDALERPGPPLEIWHIDGSGT
jgi:4-amino-4-deoxy-L-arabinose transferase-like glycosyltransferase